MVYNNDLAHDTVAHAKYAIYDRLGPYNTREYKRTAP